MILIALGGRPQEAAALEVLIELARLACVRRDSRIAPCDHMLSGLREKETKLHHDTFFAAADPDYQYFSMAPAPSLFSQAGFDGDIGPARHFFVDIAGELFPRSADQLHVSRLQGVYDLFGLDRLVGGPRELVQDDVGNAGRRHQTKPEHGLKIGDSGLRHGRKVGTDAGSLAVRGGERDERPVFHMRNDRRTWRKHPLDTACQQVDHRFRAACIRDMDDIDLS
jgi:hypothetical protein